MSSGMAVGELIAEKELKKERESFNKRRPGLVLKTEQLRRVWPLCKIKQMIWDEDKQKMYIYQSTDNFPAMAQLEQFPNMSTEILVPDDFETDDEHPNDNDNDADNDEESGKEVKASRKTPKRIRVKKRPRQVTSRKKAGKDGAVARPPPFLIKDVLARKDREEIGSRRVQARQNRQKLSKSTSPIVKQQKITGSSWTRKLWLPPLPTFKSFG